LNLFYDIGDAWPRGAGPYWHRGCGVALKTESRAAYLFGAEFRRGLAKGRDEGGKTTGYLRLGRSF
jgi:hypothetical protein